jgi:hypothetical protein
VGRTNHKFRRGEGVKPPKPSPIYATGVRYGTESHCWRSTNTVKSVRDSFDSLPSRETVSRMRPRRGVTRGFENYYDRNARTDVTAQLYRSDACIIVRIAPVYVLRKLPKHKRPSPYFEVNTVIVDTVDLLSPGTRRKRRFNLVRSLFAHIRRPYRTNGDKKKCFRVLWLWPHRAQRVSRKSSTDPIFENFFFFLKNSSRFWLLRAKDTSLCLFYFILFIYFFFFFCSRPLEIRTSLLS